MIYRLVFATIFSLVLGLPSFAQPQFCNFGQCRDTISPIYVAPFLPVDFLPVCGCDGKTYKNINFMWAQNVCQVQFNGPCEDIAMDLFPNPISNYLPLSSATAKIRMMTQTGTSVFFQISDLWGNLFVRQYFTVQPGTVFSTDLNLGGVPTGIYIANAISNGQVANFKIAVVN